MHHFKNKQCYCASKMSPRSKQRPCEASVTDRQTQLMSDQYQVSDRQLLTDTVELVLLLGNGFYTHLL